MTCETIKRALSKQIIELKEEVERQQQIVANYRADFKVLFLEKNRLKEEKNKIRKKLRKRKQELDSARLEQKLTSAWWTENQKKEILYLQRELDKRDEQLAKVRRKERAIQKPLAEIERQQLLIVGEIASDNNTVKKAIKGHYRKKYDRASPWKVTFWSNKELKEKHISQLEKSRSKYDLLIIALLHDHKGIQGSANLITDLKAGEEQYLKTILPGSHEKKPLTCRQLLNKLDQYEKQAQSCH